MVNKIKDIDKTNSKLVKSVEHMGNHFQRFMDDFAESKGLTPDRIRKKPIQSDDFDTPNKDNLKSPTEHTIWDEGEDAIATSEIRQRRRSTRIAGNMIDSDEGAQPKPQQNYGSSANSEGTARRN